MLLAIAYKASFMPVHSRAYLAQGKVQPPINVETINYRHMIE